MLTKRKFFFIISVLGLTFSPFLFKVYSSFKRDYFSCESHFTINKNNNTIRAIVYHRFTGNKGDLEYSFTLSHEGVKIGEIHRSITFSFQREDNTYILVSNETLKNTNIINLFNPYIPDFYLIRDRGVKVDVRRLKNGDFVFFTNNIPLGICKKTK